MPRLPPSLLSLFSTLHSSSQGQAPEAPDAGPPSGEEPQSQWVSFPVRTRFYPAGAVVVREGAPGSTMFVIMAGRVALMRQPEDGGASVMGHLSAGDFFGELALLTGAPRTATVMAVERTVLLELSRPGLEQKGVQYGVTGTLVRLTSRERLLADALRASPLLAALPPELWLQLGSAFDPCTVAAGEQLLTRHAPGEALYLLLRGRCAVFHTHEDGRQSPYPELEEGALFGEISLLRGHQATATVKTLTPCTLLRLERSAFNKYLKGQPALRGALVRLGLERLQRTMLMMNRPDGA